MVNYAKHVSRKVTPQSEKASSKQKKNSAGGYTFKIDDWDRLDRFLVLGSDGGTYYASEKKLTKQNAKCVERLLKKSVKSGLKVVERIVEISQAGRAPKNDQAIFALALAASCDSDTVRKAALEALPKVCRIGTHRFQFAAMVNELRGWGRGLRNAFANCFNSMPADRLAYQLVKYQQRDGWSNRDLLRLCHAGKTAPTAEHQAAYRWVVAGADGLGKRKVKRRKSDKSETVVRYDAVGDLPELIQAYEKMKSAKTENKVVKLITKHRLTHEMVPTQFKNSPAVWEALLENMPVGAMIRNLGKMTKVGIIKPLSAGSKKVAETLGNVEVLKKGRVHPLSVLTALKIYGSGHGLKGSLNWTPDRKVIDALDDAFYLSFDAVEPTGKNILLALDVSGSMGSPIANSPLTCREACAALAMVTARTEQNYHFIGFTGGTHRYYGGRNDQKLSNVSSLNISAKQRLDTVVRTISGLPFGGTDCALPMMWAQGNKIDVDGFVVLTDNETWAGSIHPHQALAQYRKAMDKPQAKSVVVGMTATKFSIANPDDPGMMDVVGFDTAAPAVMADFIRE
ncbi:MAG: TROVE domain-containing protein [Candidatus Thorarchaeota archaeon]